jgi:N-acetyl-anhydromuramyl-L-alanine amidase AmpD
MSLPATIQLGSSGPDVERWQRIVGCRVTSEFDTATDTATRAWQRSHGLSPDGVVGPLTWAAGIATEQSGSIPFVAARNFTRGREGSEISLVVIHTMEAPEKVGTARAVANWFAGPTAPQASAHYCVDANEVIQCVREEDVAWAAPGANRTGIHLEHAGFANQKLADWNDKYSESTLRRSAALVAAICARYRITIRKLSPADLIAGARGLCGHVDVTNAFHKSDHTDPGPNFPWDDYIELVRAAGEEPAREPDAIA